MSTQQSEKREQWESRNRLLDSLFYGHFTEGGLTIFKPFCSSGQY